MTKRDALVRAVFWWFAIVFCIVVWVVLIGFILESFRGV